MYNSNNVLHFTSLNLSNLWQGLGRSQIYLWWIRHKLFK